MKGQAESRTPAGVDDHTSGRGDSFGPIRAALLDLLGALDEAASGSPQAFYDRICEAVCELTEMTRCALLLYEEREKRVLPAGSHGIDGEILAQLQGTLEETPIAARALAEDRVIVSSQLASAIPARHRNLPGVAELACIPVAAGDRWLGVMLCDRGGRHFTIDAPQRDLIWALGKTAAHAASTRRAMAQHERAKLLAERVALAREVHDRVIQRLFGLSLVLGPGDVLDADAQRRASEELQAALSDLRTAMQRSDEPGRPPPSASLRGEVERLSRNYPRASVDAGELTAEPPDGFQALAQSVLAEALHNADKHADAREILVASSTADEAFVLEIRNDGVTYHPRPVSGGMGLRLAALDALQRGGVLEFGPFRQNRWRVRLLLPMDPDDGAEGSGG